MAANIAHEIRNPLGSIELFSSLLKKEAKSESAHHLIEHISSATQSMNHIISNLLEYTKPRPIIRKPIDLHEFLQQNLNFSKQLVEYNQVQVHTNFLAESTMIRGETELLKQVFNNIFLNALQAMIEPGEIHIATKNLTVHHPQVLKRFVHVPEHYRKYDLPVIELNIRDTGTGMNMEVRKHVFDPFFTTKERGTGLGMAIVHNIIESHGAIIDVESEIDQGTCFTMLFPISQEDVDQEPWENPRSRIIEEAHY